jgi:hypothetical protein
MTRFKFIKNFQHFIFLSVITFFIVFQYFNINQFSKFKWYHEFANDSDPSYAAQTWAVVNGGRVTYLHHPGVTVYTIDGLIFKILSSVKPGYEKLTDIKKISTETDELDTLNIATQTGRKIALLSVVIFMILIYFSIYLLSSDSVLSFLITFYISLSKAVIQHSGIIRPEVYSLIFVFLAGLTCLIYFKVKVAKNTRNELVIFVLTGIFLCLALFSKVQVALYILFLFLTVMIFLISQFHSVFEDEHGKRSLMAAGLGFLNIVIMPWWALSRPRFLTPDYLKSIAGDDFGKIYGPAPDTFVPIVAAGLMILFLFSLLLYDLGDYSKTRFRIYLTISTLINAILTGVIITTYIILLPVFHDFSSYVENTHHIVYALITNVFYAGFMENPHFLSIESLHKIFSLHSQNSMFLFFNPLYLVAFTSIIILVKLVLKNQKKKPDYLLALAFLFIAFVMDYFSTLRWTTLYDHYAVYSLPVYFIGIAFYIKTEFGTNNTFRDLGLMKKTGYLIILAVLLLNVSFRSFSLLNTKKVDIPPADLSDRQLAITRAIAKPFWEMIDSVLIVDQNLKAIPRMVSNERPIPIKVLYSSQLNNDEWAAFRAFNKEIDWHGWHSQKGTTGFIGIDFGRDYSRNFTKYSLSSTINYMDYMPKDFDLEVSNDGNTWKVLDEQVNQTNWASTETRSYSFLNNSSYRFYRINVKTNNGADYILISEINFE